MIFHSVSKSMLFQAVGSIENSLGSRDIEDMHGLLLRLPRLTYIMGVGIAGMYLAPFGMLISKWVALRAFVDAGNYLLVIFLAYGSATTMLYWTKWAVQTGFAAPYQGQGHRCDPQGPVLSMYIHAAATLGLCLLFPLVSSRVVTPIIQELYGTAHEVLSMSVLTTMAIMLVSVLVRALPHVPAHPLGSPGLRAHLYGRYQRGGQHLFCQQFRRTGTSVSEQLVPAV